MKKTVFPYCIYYLLTSILALTAAPALSQERHYAASSVLSEGRWATVEVDGTGMTLVTDVMLRNLGFSDPSKVRVYGAGGNMLSESLWHADYDDLPSVPSVRTAKGIVFFARDRFSWAPGKEPVRPFEHTVHPYSDKTFYFLSDRDSGAEAPRTDMTGGLAATVTTFVSRQVHEQELEHLGESGRTYLGEDFRGTRSRTFTFTLPDNASDKAQVTLRFGAKVSGGGSRLKYKANGAVVERANADTIGGVASAQYAALTTRSMEVPATGDKLDFNIEYTNSGVIFMARLDYIEVFHRRDMKLKNGQLHFYGTYSAGETLGVSGCGSGTVIYDVTDPADIRIVDYTLDGDKALLKIKNGGYAEFVAFNADQISAGSAKIGSAVANQNLHAAEAPDMLIITPDEYREGAERIADIHRTQDDMNVMLVNPQHIYNEFSSGKPDITAWRNLLKMWKSRGEYPRYCLIMGKPSYDPKGLSAEFKNMRYTPVPIWQSETGLSETSSYSNDDYIGMLDDVSPDAPDMGRAYIHVAVGRLPVKSSGEAIDVARKLEKHITSPSLGAWRNKIMIIADDGDNAQHLDQAQKVYGNMRENGGADYLYDRLYLDSYPIVSTATGQTYPQATAHMLNTYNEGVLLTNYIGHGSERGWGHEHLWEWKDLEGMRNENLTFIYSATCRFMPWDEPLISGAEELLLNTRGGVSGMISTSRTVYISSNGTLNAHMADGMLKRGDDGRLLPIGDAYREGKNKYVNDENKLRYALMADPAMRLNNISHTVSVDSIGGSDVTVADAALPEIKAGSRIRLSGAVRDRSGNIDASFNGTASIQLYDAETVVKTFGNGDSGSERMYNDRKTRLTSVNVGVKNGRWSALLTVPLEINNNYLPALVSAYAWDESGKEANGFSESLYVYGFSDVADTDTVGPKIEYFYLNTESFKDGGTVNPNPVAFVRLTDASGINISDAGVGHKVSLRLDDDTPYDDVSQAFRPDVDGNGGSLAYGLKDLAPGDHTLTLEAWDNLNNSTRASISFRVNATASPKIVSVTTDCNPATSGVTFHMNLDQPNTEMKCELSVMDLNGRVIWKDTTVDSTGLNSRMSTYWNLCDKSGARVPRGIYLYRVRVETPQGTWNSKTNKLAVAGQ